MPVCAERQISYPPLTLCCLNMSWLKWAAQGGTGLKLSVQRYEMLKIHNLSHPGSTLCDDVLVLTVTDTARQQGIKSHKIWILEESWRFL